MVRARRLVLSGIGEESEGDRRVAVHGGPA